MDISRTSNSIYLHSSRITPKKSPTTESVQRRRREIERSEKAAFWALLNAAIAVLLYYDLCYLRILEKVHFVLSYLEWLACATFVTSACYDFAVHFWPHTLMRPIVVSPMEKKLLGIQEDEFGFRVEQSPTPKIEPIYDNLPPFEIHHSFEEDEKIVTPPRNAQHSPDCSVNTSRRSKVVDKESLVDYLKNVQFFEDSMAELRDAEVKQNHL